MGIKSNYNKFLKDTTHEDEVFTVVHLSHFMYEKIAIDTSLFLYKYKAVMGELWIEGFLNLIKSMRDSSVHCCFVFDGISPVEKIGEQTKRKNSKNQLISNVKMLEEGLSDYITNNIISDHITRLIHDKQVDDIRLFMEELIDKKKKQIIDISPGDFDTIKELLDILSIPYLDAPGEAEKYCSKLCMDGKVKAVLSDDTDIIAYGAPICLSKIDTFNNTVCKVEHAELCTSLKLTNKQLLDHCIMCGTDYNTNIPGVGAYTAYKYIRQYHNIENIQQQTELDVSILNHSRVRDLFTDFVDVCDVEVPYCGPIHTDNLKNFIVKYQIDSNYNYYRFVVSKLKFIN